MVWKTIPAAWFINFIYLHDLYPAFPLNKWSFQEGIRIIFHAAVKIIICLPLPRCEEIICGVDFTLLLYFLFSKFRRQDKLGKSAWNKTLKYNEEKSLIYSPGVRTWSRSRAVSEKFSSEYKYSCTHVNRGVFMNKKSSVPFNWTSKNGRDWKDHYGWVASCAHHSQAIY